MTIKNENIVFLNDSGEYIAFDPDLVSNVRCVGFPIQNLHPSMNSNYSKECFEKSYGVKIEPFDFSEQAKFSNITLYPVKNQNILKVSNDGNEIKLGKPLDVNSCLLDKYLRIIDGPNYQLKNYLFFEIEKEAVSKILYDENEKIDTIKIFDNPSYIKKPFLTLTNGSVQYLDQDNKYQNFDPFLYENIDAKAYPTKNLFGISTFDSYGLIISQKNTSIPATIADKTLYSLQNYSLKSVENDGTINYVKSEGEFYF